MNITPTVSHRKTIEYHDNRRVGLRVDVFCSPGRISIQVIEVPAYTSLELIGSESAKQQIALTVHEIVHNISYRFSHITDSNLFWSYDAYDDEEVRFIEKEFLNTLHALFEKES